MHLFERFPKESQAICNSWYFWNCRLMECLLITIDTAVSNHCIFKNTLSGGKEKMFILFNINKYVVKTCHLARKAFGIISQAIQFTAGFLVVTVFAAGQAMAQLPDSKGTDFWLMFNGNYSTPAASLFITGDTATTGTVEIPSLSFSTSYTVTPGTVTTVTLPNAVSVTTVDTVGDKGVHVTAADEVTVYGLNQRSQSTDAFLGLPTDILGTEYINQGYQNVNIINATQFGIVAAQDDTSVTITPTVTTGSRLAGVPYTITLNQGQTYQLRNTLPAPADLSGSIIESNLPIAVFGGHQCANIPMGFTACDYIVEQLPPISTWGQSFVTMPLATRTGGDTFRVLASQDVTTVSIDGAVAVTLNRGEIYETILSSPATITADAPVLVTQYSNSSGFDGVTSDPFQVVIPPFEQFLASYTITTPATGFTTNFVNVVAANAAIGTIMLDGIVIPAADFTPIGSSGFSGTQVAIALGSHALSGPIPFGITVYGFASYDSYGYPGGLALSEVAKLKGLALTPATASSSINTEHCVIAITTDQNSAPLAGIRVDFNITGANSNSGFVFTDGTGNGEFCYTGTNVGMDTITASVGGISNTATKEWTSVAMARCDVDADSDVDRNDIGLIMAARNTSASGADDPRDADGNGIIDANDARQCVLQCTHSRCVIN